MNGIRPSVTHPRWRIAALIGLLVCFAALASGQSVLSNGQGITHVYQQVSIPTVIFGIQGYAVFVPPGANSMTIRFESTSVLTPIEMLVRHNKDVGFNGLHVDDPEDYTREDVLTDLFVPLDANGIAELTLSAQSDPPLMPGIYFVGFFILPHGARAAGTTSATVTGGGTPRFPAVRSSFETNLEGWARNDSESPLPGTNVGAASASIQFSGFGGNPDGHATIRKPAGRVDEWFVAPPEFLVNFLALDEPKIEFDMARLTGSFEGDVDIQVRLFGETGGYRFFGPRPPSVPSGWRTTVAPVQRELWSIIPGTAPDFVETFSNPQRIEILATYNNEPATVGLDNVMITSRGDGPALPALPSITGFSGGLDGWGLNFPPNSTVAGANAGDEDSQVLWNDPEGNPGGFLRLAEAGGEGIDAFVAPGGFLGDYTGLVEPRFEFDYRHQSTNGAISPVTIWIFGGNSAYRWQGAVPADNWGHQIAMLDAAQWELVEGAASFEEVLADVERIEVSGEQVPGPERNSLDNFSLLTADSPPVFQTLSVVPGVLAFSTREFGPAPGEQSLEINTSAGSAEWAVLFEGAIANRISLSELGGQTPDAVTVSVDVDGLAQGSHTGQIVFYVPGATVPDQIVDVTINIAESAVPAPQISQGSVTHSATFAEEIAPGAIASLFGTDLGGPAGGTSTVYGGQRGDMLPTDFNGVKIGIYETFGVHIADAPMFYLSDTQINFQMPNEAAGRSQVSLRVENAGVPSESIRVRVVPIAPGFFLHSGTRAVAINEDGTLNATDNPSHRRELITLYLTGQGRTAPEWETGRAAGIAPLVRTPADAHAFIGGVEANIQYLGLAPGLVGVLQLNLYAPFETPTGDQVIYLQLDGVRSNEGLVSIQ